MPVPIKIFSYDQTAAPQVTGEVNKLDPILYACLVTGFNSKNISTITVAANVATVTTSTAHGYNQYDIIKVEGANEIVFNDEFTIASVPTTTTFTFPLTTGLSSATGTITCKIAPLGWTREFTGTNKSVYRSPTGNRFYLRVDDSNTMYSIITCYESMTGVDTGTNAVGPVYWVKSNAASTATREWYLVGNDKTFYLFDAWSSSYPTLHIGYAFGEFSSLKAGDAFNTMLIGHTATAPSAPASNQAFTYVNGFANTTGHLLVRPYSSAVGSVSFAKQSLPLGQMGWGTGINYPNLVDNGLHLYPLEIIEGNAVIRGRMPGLFTPLESTGVNILSNDRTVIIDNKTYIAIRVCSNNSGGNCWLDITGDW